MKTLVNTLLLLFALTWNATCITGVDGLVPRNGDALQSQASSGVKTLTKKGVIKIRELDNPSHRNFEDAINMSQSLVPHDNRNSDWKKLWDEYVQMKLPLYLDQPSAVKDANTAQTGHLSSQEIRAKISELIPMAASRMRAGYMLTHPDWANLKLAVPLYAGALDLYRRVLQLDPGMAGAILKSLMKELTYINSIFSEHSDFVKAVKDLIEYCQTRSTLPVRYTPNWPYRSEVITHDIFTRLTARLNAGRSRFLGNNIFIVDMLAVTALDLKFQWTADNVRRGNLALLMNYIDGVKVESDAPPYVRRCADLIHPYYAKLEEFARIHYTTAWANRGKVTKDLAELWEAYWGISVPLYFKRSDDPEILSAEAKEQYRVAKRASHSLNRGLAETMAVAALDLYSRSAERYVDSNDKERVYDAMREIRTGWFLVKNHERLPPGGVRRSRTWNPPDVTLIIQEWPIKWKQMDLNHARQKRDQLFQLKVLQEPEGSDTADRVMVAILYLEFQYVLLSVEVGDLKPLKETLDALKSETLAGMSWTTRYYVMEVSQLMIPLYKQLLTYVSNHLYYEWSILTTIPVV